jgi:hypothetical protein
MKWIYGEVRNISNKVLKTYRINPKYIVAVNLNNRELIVEGLMDKILYYPKEYDEEIYNTIYELNKGENE